MRIINYWKAHSLYRGAVALETLLEFLSFFLLLILKGLVILCMLLLLGWWCVWWWCWQQCHKDHPEEELISLLRCRMRISQWGNNLSLLFFPCSPLSLPGWKLKRPASLSSRCTRTQTTRMKTLRHQWNCLLKQGSHTKWIHVIENTPGDLNSMHKPVLLSCVAWDIPTYVKKGIYTSWTYHDDGFGGC